MFQNNKTIRCLATNVFNFVCKCMKNIINYFILIFPGNQAGKFKPIIIEIKFYFPKKNKNKTIFIIKNTKKCDETLYCKNELIVVQKKLNIQEG